MWIVFSIINTCSLFQISGNLIFPIKKKLGQYFVISYINISYSYSLYFWKLVYVSVYNYLIKILRFIIKIYNKNENENFIKIKLYNDKKPISLIENKRRIIPVSLSTLRRYRRSTSVANGPRRIWNSTDGGN